MVAVLESCGAFIYGCTDEEADRRITKKRGGMDYDEAGNHRGDGGMVGWLFMDSEIVNRIASLGCTAVYLNRYNATEKRKEYLKVCAGEEMRYLGFSIQKMIMEAENEG